MPLAAPYACPHGGIVGRCDVCVMQARARDRARGTAHERGYTYRRWIPFTRHFRTMLIEAGILPICGAALKTGPVSRDSKCRDAGFEVWRSDDGSELHCDHEPKLEDWERKIPERVCDADRIVLKCRSCHSKKTRAERRSVRHV